MATNQTGIAIVIKAFLPTGKTIDEQFNTLSLVKAAHESGDYSAVLAAAHIDEVKSEQKTRRVEEQPAKAPEGANVHGIGPDTDGGPNPDYVEPAPEGEPPAADENDDTDVPEFLKKGKKQKAA